MDRIDIDEVSDFDAQAVESFAMILPPPGAAVLQGARQLRGTALDFLRALGMPPDLFAGGVPGRTVAAVDLGDPAGDRAAFIQANGIIDDDPDGPPAGDQTGSIAERLQARAENVLHDFDLGDALDADPASTRRADAYERMVEEAFMAHVRQEIQDLRVPITYATWSSLRMNSYERKYLLDKMTDACLVEHCRSLLLHTQVQEYGPHNMGTSYEEAVIGDVLPELLRRMDALIAQNGTVE